MEVFKIVKSVLSAMIGVQKKENLENDFSQKSVMPFVIVGILMTLIFLVTIWGVVQLVLNQ